MRSTGSTSATGGPDDPADGLHPVLHVSLGAGQEQERLGAGRHLLPLPGTTCKTGDTGLLQGPRVTATRRRMLAPTGSLFFPAVGGGRLSQTRPQWPGFWFCFGSNPRPPPPSLGPPTPSTLPGALPGFSVVLWSLLHFHIKKEIIRAPWLGEVQNPE